MKFVSIAAALAASIAVAHAAPAKKENSAAAECGGIAQSVMAAYSMAANGVGMFDAINGIEESYRRIKVPAAKRAEYMVNVRNLISSGFAAYEHGLSQSETYQAAYDVCMNSRKSL